MKKDTIMVRGQSRSVRQALLNLEGRRAKRRKSKDKESIVKKKEKKRRIINDAQRENKKGKRGGPFRKKEHPEE